ncbi:MAG: hypothetical protein WA294_00560 [Acidobacteriaceae bacterium]
MSTQKVECRRGRWRDRPCCVLGNDVVALTHLTGGGQIPDFHFLDAPALNPFWIPQWRLRDPMLFRPARDEAKFGQEAAGKLLCAIAGHSVCLGVYGMPSDEEVVAGAALHGDAGVRRWTASLCTGRDEARLRFSVRLPAFGLLFARELSLRPGESVVRVRESVRNLLGADQFIQWQQHAVLGPPFLNRNDCIITLPGLRGLTDPADYEGHPALAADAEFNWPSAPAIGGGTVNLQHPCQQPGKGFVAGIQVDPRRQHGFACAVNHAERLAFGYIFRRLEFPWVTIWEENCARTAAPWSSREQARAFEFGVSPLPIGRAETLRRGDVFGTPTLLRVPARASVHAAWAMFLCRVPRGVRHVNDIVCQPNRLRLTTDGSAALTIPAGGIGAFLDGPAPRSTS